MESARQSTGCVKFFGFLIGGSLLICAVLFVAGSAFPDVFGGRPTPTPKPQTIHMTGTILLSPANCEFEQSVRITPRNGKPQSLQMNSDAYVPGRACNLRVDIDVEQADAYEVHIEGVGSETFPHQLIATTDDAGRPLLRFDLAM